jgi:hypothetical protein
MRVFMAAILIGLAPMALAVAQSSQEASSQEPMSRSGNLPRLGEIMLGKQWRHIKLWFAGKGHNWDLAAYELAQIRASLIDAASLYSGIPVSDAAIMAGPIQSIDKAVQSKDDAAFVKAFNDLTVGCNACHRDMERGFIEIRVPGASPFTNQVFAPPAKR